MATLVLTCVTLVAVVVFPAASLEKVTSGDSYGDFETVGQTPQGWAVSAPAPNRGVVTSSRAISGARSLLVEDLSSTAASAVGRRVAVRAGAVYHAQGYAYTSRGIQSLNLIFADAAGVVIARHSTPTTGATMVWSRAEVRATAPPTAKTVVLQVSSSTAAVSNVWWDAIGIISPMVTNASFESAPTSSAPVPGWSVAVSGGATAGVTTAQARLGSRSLRLDDRTTTGYALVRSEKLQVFPGVSHDVRVWVRPTGGARTQTIRWYDTAQRQVSSQGYALSGGLNAWSLVARRLTAPPTAHYATIEVATSLAGTGTADVDAVSFLPAEGVPVKNYASASLGHPVDGFANTNTTAATVIAGRTKVFSVVSGMPAELQMVDVQSGALEVQRPLPGIITSWALTTGSDGSLYAAGTGGLLFRYLPGSKTLRNLGRVTATAGTVWDLERGADGRIWGVSYPNSELWNYDPSTDRITSLGSVSPSHAYARSLAVSSGYAYVGLGSTYPAVMRVSLSDGSKTRIALPVPVTSGIVSNLEALGRYLLVHTPAGVTASGANYASERRLYDTRTGSWSVAANVAGQAPSELDSQGRFYYLSAKWLWSVNAATGQKAAAAPTSMTAGRDRLVVKASLDGIAGEWMLAYDPSGVVRAIELGNFTERSFRVPFQPTKMRIKSLDAGPNGSLYAGGYGGASLAVVQPDTGARQHYPAARGGKDVIGEVEGTSPHGAYQYLGTYTEGNIFRYDTTQSWVDGSNPKLLATLGPSHRQDRPISWATAGDRTFFGTMPKYGVLGGVLGIIENDTSNPVIVPEPVVDQGIVGLAASGNVVYGGTSRWGGLGATPTQASAKVFAYDASTSRKLWETTPITGAEAFGAVSFGPGGSLWAASGPLLVELDPRTGALLRKVMIYPAPATTHAVFRNADLVYADGVFYLAAMDKVYVVDPATLRVTAAVPSGATMQRIAVSGNKVFYPAETELRYINR